MYPWIHEAINFSYCGALLCLVAAVINEHWEYPVKTTSTILILGFYLKKCTYLVKRVLFCKSVAMSAIIGVTSDSDFQSWSKWLSVLEQNYLGVWGPFGQLAEIFQLLAPVTQFSCWSAEWFPMMVGNWKVERLHSFTSLSASNATWLLLSLFVSICCILVIIFTQNELTCLEK